MTSRVLVVDDNLSVLCGLSKALPELCDFDGDVRTVVNGREAIDEVSQCSYDICFLDIRLPDINGMNVLKDIKEISPTTNVILMSASPISNELNQMIENKEAYFIDKPFNFEWIKQLMKMLLGGSSNFFDTSKYSKPKQETDKRMYKRKQLSKVISFHIMEDNLLELGGSLNISFEGLCIETYYPLKKGQVLLFNKGIAHKTGTVVWSKAKDNNNYRVGIKLV